MAVKLSSYYWFRNNYLASSLEDPHRARHWFGEELCAEDKKTLKFIIEELDDLKNDSYFQQGSSVRNINVVIPSVVELKDVTSNSEVAAALFQGIHGIMEKYLVNVELYQQLGNCFDEIGIPPSSDIEGAVKHAATILRTEKYPAYKAMCWKTIKEHEKRKAELKKKNPLKYFNLYESHNK